MCTKWWISLTLLTKLLILFGTATGVLLFVTGVSSGVYDEITGKLVHDDLNSGFMNLAESDMLNILINSANLFDTKFRQLVANFPGPMTTSFEDSFRPDYPFGYIKSYYNWPEQLVNTKFDTKYNANVTYYSSSINVYSKTIYDIPYLSEDLQNIINQTASMDYLFSPTFNFSSDFFAGYITVPSSSGNTFKRYYPGKMNDNQISTYINFNGVVRPWYISEQQNINYNSPTKMTFTEPYIDQINGKLMITIGRIAFNPVSNVQIGGFGADMILDVIQSLITKINYLGITRSILFDIRTGYVIADSKQLINNLITYNDIISPSINVDLWNKILTVQDQFITNGDYLMVSHYMTTSSGLNYQYVLVSIIQTQYILDTYNTIMTQVNGFIKTTNILTISIAIILFFVTIPIILCITTRITSPFQKIIEAGNSFIKNIGNMSLVDSRRTSKVGPDVTTGVTETDSVIRSLNTVLDKHGSITAAATSIHNPLSAIIWSQSIPDLPAENLPNVTVVSIPPVPIESGMSTGMPKQTNHPDQYTQYKPYMVPISGNVNASAPN